MAEWNACHEKPAPARSNSRAPRPRARDPARDRAELRRCGRISRLDQRPDRARLPAAHGRRMGLHGARHSSRRARSDLHRPRADLGIGLFLVEGNAPRCPQNLGRLTRTSPEGIARSRRQRVGMDRRLLKQRMPNGAGARPYLRRWRAQSPPCPISNATPHAAACAVGTPPAHLGMRLVSDESPVTRRANPPRRTAAAQSDDRGSGGGRQNTAAVCLAPALPLSCRPARPRDRRRAMVQCGAAGPGLSLPAAAG